MHYPVLVFSLSDQWIDHDAKTLIYCFLVFSQNDQTLELVFEIVQLCLFYSFMASLLNVFEAFFQHVLYNSKPDYGACKSLHALLLDKASELLKHTQVRVLDNILNLIVNHIRLYKVSFSSFVTAAHVLSRLFIRFKTVRLPLET